jgi:hypothetical protein
LAAVACLTGGALAHGGQIVVVEPAVAAPGTELSIHGDFLWTDMPVTVTVSGAAAPREPIATATTDGTGHLEVRAVLPDLRAGTYTVVVTAASGETIEAGLVVESSSLAMPLAIGFGALLIGVVALGAVARARSGRRRHVVRPPA